VIFDTATQAGGNQGGNPAGNGVLSGYRGIASMPIARESSAYSRQHIYFVRAMSLTISAHAFVDVSQKINRLSPAVIVGTLRLRVNGRRL